MHPVEVDDHVGLLQQVPIRLTVINMEGLPHLHPAVGGAEAGPESGNAMSPSIINNSILYCLIFMICLYVFNKSNLFKLVIL